MNIPIRSKNRNGTCHKKFRILYHFVSVGIVGIAGIRPEYVFRPEKKNKFFYFTNYFFILYFLVLNILYLFVDLYRINILKTLY